MHRVIPGRHANEHYRIRAIIISTPLLVASSILMYKRLVLGEEQKRMPKPRPIQTELPAEVLEEEKKWS